MADGRAAVERGADWVTGRLEEFTPWAGSGGRGREDRSRLKPFGELAMVFAYLTAWAARATPPWPELDRVLDRWRTFLVDRCSDERYLRQARADLDDGPYLMQPYAWLRSTGVRLPAAEDVVTELWRSGRGPTSIGQVHSFAKGGYVRGEPRWDDFCRRQVLAPTWSTGRIAREAYRVTHAVFYATDLGDRRTGLTSAERRSVAAVVERVADHARRTRHWDRLLEAVIATRSLGSSVEPFARARADVERARSADGAVPRAADAGGGGFAVCYHATLVGLLDGVQHEVLGRAA
ncbi:DUF6895 family protein [Umezawaea sp.]|uniref:DUF6895 family protein n=1 Tax=Umezawaea sp. TaxID=1955258 RepID=UPI002ED45DE0